MGNFKRHLSTVCTHKKYVFEACCKLGIPIQGIFHDMSKFSFVELFESVEFYTGDKSPLSNARKSIGYSKAWMHHVRKNLGHWEAWLDIDGKDNIIPIPMPNRCIKESIADRIAACRTYNPETWDYTQPLKYYMKGRHENIIHPETETKLIHCLTLLSEKGEGAFKEIRKYLKN